MIENGKYKGFDENIKSQLDESSKTLIGAPITTGLDTAYAINAPEINWAGYKLYDEDLTSTGHMLSYIESQLDSKSSSGVWDNIKGSNYITSQITIYATSNVKTPPECDFSGEPISIDNYDKQIYANLPEGWVESLDNVESNYYVFQTSVYEVRTLNNERVGYHEPIGEVIYLLGENGINGNFKSTVFCRTNEIPKAPSNGAVYKTGLPTTIQVYNLSNNEITGVNWSDGIPEGKEILWASTAIISDNNGSEDETAVWTTPRQMTDTATYDVEFSPYLNDAGDGPYKLPSNVDDNTGNRHNAYPSKNQYWFDLTLDNELRNGISNVDENGQIPISGGNKPTWKSMIWRAERECINGVWSNWTISRIKGEQGTAGVKGDFKSTVFKRSEDNPGIPNDPNCDYDHPVPSGWSDGIPNGTGPVWSSWRTFSVNDNNSSWTTPTLVADTPTYDVEFSPYSNNDNTAPRTTENIDTSNDWFDPTKDTLPEDITWEDMIWRAERNRATSQDEWSEWVITKIKGEDGKIGLNSPYFEQRWGVFDKIVTPTAPDNNAITLNTDHTTWRLTPQYTSGKNTWMTARKVIYTINNNEQSAQYDEDSTWSEPMRMSGVDGVSQPIQPVLKYQWTASNTVTPQLDQDVNPGNEWKESPGNPTSTNKYLWMIQGQRQNGSMITWDANSDETVGTNEYWTSPVCLSGADGQPGKDGDDLEFIYRVYDEVPAFDNDNDNPAYWEVSSQDNYLGPENNEWNNNPTGVTITDKYEYCSYRRKTGNPKAWTKFSTPFPWSIYGENGLDGDGVEYIYAVTPTDTAPTQPEITSDNYASSQQSEWGVDENINGVIWHDDPQQLNNENQKYQWVSVRKYRYPKQNETLCGNVLDPNKKYWFDYSTPQLWNWYVNDGTNADRIVMLYKRTNSNTDCGDLPGHSEKMLYTVGTNGWAESPGNNTSANNDDYLWMISNYYSKKEIQRTGTIIYTITGEWSTPVCLTGEPGHEGEDGSDIEFIYYRTADDNKVPTIPDSENFEDGQYNESDWPFVNLKETHEDIDGSSVYDSAITKDGIKYLIDDSNYNILEDETISSLDNFENITSDMLHDVWTDNPLGVTSIYDYEYAAVRRKPSGNDSQWGEFSPVFLWSKYGEDGVDGDGIEYIFYRSSDENEVTFDSENNNLPPSFNLNTSGNDAFQKPEVLGNNWTDDPQGVNETNVWEYVSVRKFREITNSNLNDIPESFRGQVHVGDKIWFPYSDPVLWSKYAFDAVASNLTIETDNDMMAVAIDGQNTTRNASSNSAQVFLYHNLLLLSSDKYVVSIVSSNCDQSWLTIANTDNKWKVTIDIPVDTLLPTDGSFNFTIKAKVKNDNTSIPEEIRDAERFYTFKVIGLSLSTIYQLKTDKIVIHRDVNNTLENVNVTMFNISDINDAFTTGDSLPENFYIFAKPIRVSNSPDIIIEPKYDDEIYGNVQFLKNDNSFNIKLYTSSDTSKSFLTSVEFNLVYTSNAEDKQRIIDSFNSNNGTGGTVQPQYGGARLITNGILVDREIVSVISDGANGNPGTDSKSQEYIYFVTDDISYFEGGNHANINPNNWDTHENVSINNVSYYAYLTDDFPFVNGQTSYLGWEDTHIGISEEHPYQFMSTREYNTTTKEWGKFSSPECSHNWGHSGEDGDGVEYIYYLNDSAAFNGDKPQTWYNDTNYQNSEYIKTNTNWTDNPEGVSKNNKYEWISVRKYKYECPSDILWNAILKEGIYNVNEWQIFENDFNINSYNTKQAFTLKYEEEGSPISFQDVGNGNIKQFLEDNQAFSDGNPFWEAIKYVYKLFTTYDELEDVFSHTKNKIWSPYSRPTLWAKYGEKGSTGDPGGSGLTFDFDNPSIQIAVNSNGKIKDYQEVTTYLNVYEGASKIPAKDISLSIISNGTHDTFEHSYSDTDKYGYILFNSNSNNNGTSTYYTWKIGDVDIDNIGTNTIGELNGNSNIEFNIKYNNNNYVKRVSLVPIQYGEDGANAVVFDLYCPTSVIHYNAMDDTPTFNPTTISDIKVRKIENSNVNYIITDGNNGNNNGFAISYYATLPLADSQVTGGNTGSSEEGTIGRKSSPQMTTNNIFGYTYDGILDINNKINTALNGSKLYDIPKTVKLSLYHTENGTSSLWDETDLEIIYDGINGTDSFAEEFIYSITYVPNDNSGGEDPSTWAIRDSRDYIPDNQTSYWKDHPQGISLEHPIEWMSHRTYDYVNKTWNKYEAPVEWSHYGEKGLDGDGIEYIFKTHNSSSFGETGQQILNTLFAYPITHYTTFFTNIEKYPDSGNYVWYDDPVTNLSEGTYQFASIRKYKLFTQDDYNNFESIFNNAVSYVDGAENTLTLFGKLSVVKGALEIAGNLSTETGKNNVLNYLAPYIGKKIWFPYSEPTIWSSNIPGQPGQNGSDAIVLDWTNDQINLAVDENGKIYNNVYQEKSTTLTLLNSGSLTINSLNCYNYDEEHFAISLTNVGEEGEGDTALDPTKINIYSSYSSNDKDFTINISIDSNFNGNITIPENGLEVTFEVTLSDYTTISKVLKICGQHIPSDGQNPVTYELDVTPNSLSYSSFSPNANVTINVLKYNGTSVTRLSTSEDFAADDIYFKTELYDITFDHFVADNTYNQLSSKLINKTFVSRSIYNTRYAVIKMYHYDGSTYTQIDSETIPVICDGEQGAQGFTGAIVRMRGEWTANTKYGNGKYNSNYDGTSLLYKDIVIWNSHYMTPNSSSKYITTTNDNSGLCQGSAYVSSSTFSANEWTEATQFDFIATKLLYADQALINQISTHDLIATNQDGYPVAGVTSGSKMHDKNNTEIVSYLSTLGTVNYSENTVQSQNDPSNVRIFAGEIWDGINSYSLTYAPFNVRQDGTAYMSKAIIEGTVTASNLKLKENVNANTQDQKGSFTYWDIINGDRYVPNLNEGEVGLYYILSIYGNSNSNIRIKTPYPGDNVPRNAFFKKSINGKSVLSGNSSNDDIYMRPPKNTLCQLVGINADNITYWNIIETPLAEQKIPDTILEHYDCTDDVILFAYNLGDYYTNNNTVKISYLCTRADDYDGFLPIRKVTFEGGSGTDADDVWVEYTFLTYLQSDSSKHTTNGAYANLGFLKYVKDKYQSWQPEGEPVNPNS